MLCSVNCTGRATSVLELEGVTCSWVDLQERTVPGSLADPRSHGLNSFFAGLSTAPLTPQAAGSAAHCSLVNINY